MKIYHYTSIQTLALILKSKSIRFNRLDFVDDIEESIYKSGTDKLSLNLAKYVFVSCWTKDAEENLALWNMYTNNKGVRIGIDENPFVRHQSIPNFYSFCENQLEIGDDYIMPAINNESKLHDVKYVQNPKEKINSLLKEENGFIHINTGDLGLYKDNHWQFQNECRFRIMLYPRNDEMIKKCMNKSGNISFDLLFGLYASLIPSLSKGSALKETEKFVPLAPDPLANIEVMLGPKTTDADKYIVEKLLADFPNSTLVESHFRGKIRTKFE